MSIEKTGALVSRGVGVGLIIMGVSSMLYWPFSFFVPAGLVTTSGWTSYSPLAPSTTTTVNPSAQVRDTFDYLSSMTQLYLPNIAQIFGGIFMLVCSKPVGRWLASGLGEEREEGK